MRGRVIAGGAAGFVLAAEFATPAAADSHAELSVLHGRRGQPHGDALHERHL
jgi:hypothetical protein